MVKATVALVAALALCSGLEAQATGNHKSKYLKNFSGDFSDVFNQFMSKWSEKHGRRLNAVDKSTMLDDAKNFLGDVLANLAEKTEMAIDTAKEVGEKIVYKYTEGNDHAILGDIFGKNYHKFFPHNITIEALSHLGAGDAYSKLMKELSDVDSFEEAYEAIDKASYNSKLCKRAKKKESEKEPTKCEGPKVSLELEPKKCIIDSHTHTVECEPAKLVLKKIPGKCTFKHHTPFEWHGKVCKIEKKFGHEKHITKGGEAYQPTFHHK
jgi:flagellar hook-basal body complex protein FliE